MPDVFNKWINQFKEFWGNLDKSQKNRIYITSGILTVCLIFSLLWLTRSEMVSIVSSNDATEITEIRRILSENNIKHVLSPDKKSIMVDIRDKNNAELAIALEGYPKGGMTFEDAYSYIKINTTESDKQQIWKEYKKKNIIQKLLMFDNVIEADVELAQPEPTLFNSDLKTTAFVRINSKIPLTAEQVQGIVMVVSRSVENLLPENVTVVDNYFNILNSDAANGVGSMTTTREEIRLKRKKEIENNIYSLFRSPSDNFDFIQVVANPYIDFDTQKTQTHEYQNPKGMEGGAVTQIETIEETSKNTGTGGVPGTDSNPGETGIPTYPMAGNNGSSTERVEERKTMVYSELMTEVEKAPGNMVPEKSTMSVTLWWGHKVIDESKLSQDFIDQILLNVSKASGIPAENISVAKYKLAPSEEAKITTVDKIKEYIEVYGLPLLIIAMAIGMLIVAMSGRRHKEDLELEPAIAAGTRFKMPEPPEEVPELDVEDRSKIRRQIDKIIQQKPEAVAQLLRNWLSDDWD